MSYALGGGILHLTSVVPCERESLRTSKERTTADASGPLGQDRTELLEGTQKLKMWISHMMHDELSCAMNSQERRLSEFSHSDR
jgi:hypothetical protein